MSIVILSPYGLASEETGLLSILSAYLQQGPYQVSQLFCNGLFSLCDRDGDHGWRRGLRTCFGCIREQKSVADWSGVACEELSGFLSPEDIQESKSWALTLRDKNLESAEFKGVGVFDLCRGSFQYRYGSEVPDVNNVRQIETLRRLMVSSVRMLLASQAYLKQRRPASAFIAGGNDFITASFGSAASTAGCEVVPFRWDLTGRSVRISHPKSEKEYECPLVFEDVTSLRRDARTWPRELLRVLDEILLFLEVTKSQIELPLAAQ